MLVRTSFIALRFLGYGAVFSYVVLAHHDIRWWDFAIGMMVWTYGSMEFWKRPDERVSFMRLGIWTEVFAVILWTLTVQNGWVLLLLVSPAARAGVHLGWRDSIFVAVCSLVCIAVVWRMWPAGVWPMGVQIAAVVGTSAYSLVLGELLRQRDRLKREVQVTAFERDERIKNEERLRMAGQLHDTLGQHWTAVIRALDVAEQVHDDQQLVFISRARSAAMDGLAAMRQATHAWNRGRQSPREWLQYAEESLGRLQETAFLEVQFLSSEIDWSRFENPTDVAEVLARTLIEGATNAIRHGLATRVVIAVHCDLVGIRATIRDDGKGVKAVQRRGDEGIGLAVLKQLAAASGGVIGFESTVGRGSTLSLQVPYTQFTGTVHSVTDVPVARDGGSR
ncbi:hypothetical protein JZ785_25355 [Alicyclobacillus curvatus]|nr:hypothetical protein JZ785_25355 [Alicyclobacillus curvatus]